MKFDERLDLLGGLIHFRKCSGGGSRTIPGKMSVVAKWIHGPTVYGWREVAAVVILALLVLNAAGMPVHADSSQPTPTNATIPVSVAGRNVVYLPLVTQTQGDGREVVLPASPVCHLNGQESTILELVENHPDQVRVRVVCDPILSEVARQRAQDMGQRDYFNHVTPDGFGPNYLATQAGYKLPDWYSKSIDGNNIESIAAGYQSIEAVWDAWLASEYHRVHLLGLRPFYAEQEAVGIGYAQVPGSRYEHYWVFLSAPIEEAAN